jgi:hypothetical protein
MMVSVIGFLDTTIMQNGSGIFGLKVKNKMCEAKKPVAPQVIYVPKSLHYQDTGKPQQSFS